MLHIVCAIVDKNLSEVNKYAVLLSSVVNTFNVTNKLEKDETRSGYGFRETAKEPHCDGRFLWY